MFLVRRFHQNLTTTPVSHLPREPFHYKNPEHQLFIQAKLSVFNSLAFRLKANDQCLVLGAAMLAFGCVSFISLLSIVFFAVMIDTIAMIRASILERPVFANAYHKALNELIEIYQWAMPEGSCHWDALGLEPIQNLILTLGPLVPVKVIHRWKPADLEPVKKLFSDEDSFIKAGIKQASAMMGITARNEPSDEFKARLDDFVKGGHLRSIDYLFYGHNSEQRSINSIFHLFQPNVNQVIRETGANLVAQVTQSTTELPRLN